MTDTDWHAPPGLLARFATDPNALDDTTAASLEAHLVGCPACRGALGGSADPALVTASWEAIAARIDAPRQHLALRLLGGIGIGLIAGGGPGENVATALEADQLADVTDPMGRTFRAFADQTRSDRRALAACLRGSRRLMTRMA